MNKRKRDSPPGDIRQSAPCDAGEQPLDEQQKALVSRAYNLFSEFVDDLRDDHQEMRDARAMRALPSSTCSISKGNRCRRICLPR